MTTWLTWPAVVLILGVVAFLLFRKPLIRFLDRVVEIRINKDRAITTAPTSQESAAETKAPGAEALMKLFDNQLLLKWEETMKPNVPPAGPQRDQFLIRMVAALGIALTFQRAYSFIFGSQLRALNKVNSGSVAGGITLDAMRLIYDAAVAAEPLFYAGYSFEHWFRYLQSFDLIVITDDEMVLITLQGREFLKWLVEQGYDTSGKGY